MKLKNTLVKLVGGKALSIGIIGVGIGLLLNSIPALSSWIESGLDSGVDTQWELEPDNGSIAGDYDALEAAEGSNISIPGFESATIEARSEEVSLYLYNPESNECYFMISLYIYDEDGEEELIYQSKLVSPGQELYTITLERALEEGSYDAYISYSTYTMDDEHTPLNGANVPVTIIAK